MNSNGAICLKRIDAHEAKHIRTTLLVLFFFAVFFIGTLNILSRFLHENGLDQFQSLCPFFNATGIPCLFCGLTRSLTCLLEGKFTEALSFHPLGPALWVGGVALGSCAFGLSLFQRKISTEVSRRTIVNSATVVLLILWLGNILFSHR